MNGGGKKTKDVSRITQKIKSNVLVLFKSSCLFYVMLWAKNICIQKNRRRKRGCSTYRDKIIVDLTISNVVWRSRGRIQVCSETMFCFTSCVLLIKTC